MRTCYPTSQMADNVQSDTANSRKIPTRLTGGHATIKNSWMKRVEKTNYVLRV